MLQSYNGSEFTAQVIKELNELWPQFTMVRVKPRHSQSQGSVECANGDMKDMLAAWMTDNNTQDWSMGLCFVHNMNNSAYHSGIKSTPYAAMFGTSPKVGLISSSLPSEISWLFSAPLQKLQQNPKWPSQNQRWTIQPCNQPLRIQRVSLLRSTTNRVLLLLLLSLHLRVLLQGQAFSKTTAKCQALVHHHLPPLNLVQQSKRAREAHMSQAEKMAKRSRVDLKASEVSDNVAVPIPVVDRGKGIHVTSWGVITDRGNNNLYTIAVKTGILKNKYSRNQFDLCPQRLLSQSDTNRDQQSDVTVAAFK